MSRPRHLDRRIGLLEALTCVAGLAFIVSFTLCIVAIGQAEHLRRLGQNPILMASTIGATLTCAAVAGGGLVVLFGWLLFTMDGQPSVETLPAAPCGIEGGIDECQTRRVIVGWDMAQRDWVWGRCADDCQHLDR